MTIDLNVVQLVAEIERSIRQDDGRDAGAGLSVNRKIENGVAIWDVFLGIAPSTMTVLDSETDYRGLPPSEIATTIIRDWDAEWDN